MSRRLDGYHSKTIQFLAGNGLSSAGREGDFSKGSALNIGGAIQPRGGSGFGEQPASPGAFVPPSKEATSTIAVFEEPVSMTDVLRFNASRASSSDSGSALQPSECLSLVAIRF